VCVYAFLVFHDERTSNFVELDVADVIEGRPVAVKVNKVPCPELGGGGVEKGRGAPM
jgi:hypothetical protein